MGLDRNAVGWPLRNSCSIAVSYRAEQGMKGKTIARLSVVFGLVVLVASTILFRREIVESVLGQDAAFLVEDLESIAGSELADPGRQRDIRWTIESLRKRRGGSP